MKIDELLNDEELKTKLEYKENVVFSYKEIQVLYDFLSKIINMNGNNLDIYHHILFIDNYKMVVQAMTYIDNDLKNSNNTEKANEYKQKADLLIEKYIDRDEQGSPVYKDNKPVITDNIVEFNKSIESLNKEYAGIIAEDKKFKEGYQNLLLTKTVTFEKFLFFKDIKQYDAAFTPTAVSIYLDKV